VPQQPRDDLHTGMDSAGLDPQGRRNRRQCFRKLRVVYVDSYPYGHEMDSVLLRIHFGQNPAEFLASEEQVIRPAEVGRNAGLFQDGVPYGKLRIQVLAQGFQTYGDDYDVNEPNMDITVKMKRPAGQYSIYEDHPGEKKDEKKPQQ